ncbi:uncharacterized protein LOC117175501 [Belonocnema kinseyi]|uniref:uncharacterized protein LOC117175501 n=1 Tax=Belonocnema kinseyi TaxID=2817044 RepID=UPI00143CCAD7|nr:uncharacterized protein LOC117175501 [Belonocnema kinseyi]
MGIFICARLFTFMIFLNSVQSSLQPSHHNEEHPTPPSTPTRFQNNVRSVIVDLDHERYSLRMDDGRIVQVTREEAVRWGAFLRGSGPRPLHQQPPPQEAPLQVSLQDGDILYRGVYPVGRVHGVTIHGIGSAPPIYEPQHGDVVIRSGAPVAKYENNECRPWRHQYLE